jgi:hypothetical protein
MGCNYYLLAGDDQVTEVHKYTLQFGKNLHVTLSMTWKT